MVALVVFSLPFLAAFGQLVRDPPSYTADSIVNAASGDSASLSPYGLIIIKGANLAWAPYAMQPADIIAGFVPTALPNTGVKVWVSNVPAGLIAVAPDRLTVLIPAGLLSGPATLKVALDSLRGPEVPITLLDLAPGLFFDQRVLDDGTTVLKTLVASHPDGSLVTADAPALRGERITFHSTGLGQVFPALQGLEVPSEARALDSSTHIVVYLNDVAVDGALVSNVGLVTGQPGVYQLTVQLPSDAPADPELRIETNGVSSERGVILRIAPPPQPAPPATGAGAHVRR